MTNVLAAFRAFTAGLLDDVAVWGESANWICGCAPSRARCASCRVQSCEMWIWAASHSLAKAVSTYTRAKNVEEQVERRVLAATQEPKNRCTNGMSWPYKKNSTTRGIIQCKAYTLTDTSARISSLLSAWAAASTASTLQSFYLLGPRHE
ncbi:hypothetical protein K470DRAFT_172841 [Piedraia hortae CBS 480.64]|uniref:Uncharacterized protein n=1 Tax=Piedraia hortae CBS 480.64 TaxID=1314780 RepID=A0A6A7BQ91_9PEZI|nr:hypothetical protein K470DRAFT_172841 [Piedraia hortae CBS 480.64]